MTSISLDESQCFLALAPRQRPLHSLLTSDQRTCLAQDGCLWVPSVGGSLLPSPRHPANPTCSELGGPLRTPRMAPRSQGRARGGALLPQGCPLTSSKCHIPFRAGSGAVWTLVPLPSEDTPALTQGCVPPKLPC